MFKRNWIYQIVVGVSVLLVALSVVGFAAAQQDTTSDKPFLGIGLSPNAAGVQVDQIVPDSPAAKAGLKTGDIITAVDGKAVTADTVRDVLGAFKVGDSVKLSVTRGTDKLDLSALLAAQPAQATITTPFNGGRANRPLLGIQLADGDKGPVVRQVVPNSAAATAGLKVDDIITKIGDTDVKTAADVVKAVQALKVGDKVKITFMRGTESQTVEVTLAAAQLPNTPFNFRGGDIFLYNNQDKTWDIRGLTETNPLYTAGLRAGDKITQFDGKTYDPQTIGDYIKGLDSKATVKVDVTRAGKTMTLDVPASALANFGMFAPSGRGDFGQGFPFGMRSGARLGVQIVNLNAQTAKDRNLTQTDGALVTDVQKDSPADKAGLKVNDIITAVEGDKVDAKRTLPYRLIPYNAGETVKLDVLRDGKIMTVEVTLGQVDMSSMMPFFGNGGGFFGQNSPFRQFRQGRIPFLNIPLPNQQPGQTAPTPEAAPSA